MNKTDATKPHIHMIDSEADALTELLLKSPSSPFHEMLLEEINRATICSRSDIPSQVVTMGSEVAFLDQASGAERTVSLVYPGDADISAGRVSILTPIGAALIGLGLGQSINWPDRAGAERKLTIVAVRQPS